jgi:hypothetical protein
MKRFSSNNRRVGAILCPDAETRYSMVTSPEACLYEIGSRDLSRINGQTPCCDSRVISQASEIMEEASTGLSLRGHSERHEGLRNLEILCLELQILPCAAQDEREISSDL